MSTKKDPLTDAIFSALERGEGVFVNKKEEDDLTRAMFARLASPSAQINYSNDRETEKNESVLTREGILGEIEGFNYADLTELEDSIVIKPLPGIKSLHKEEKFKKEEIRVEEVSSEDVVRAQDDWFNVKDKNFDPDLVIQADLTPQKKELPKIDYREKKKTGSWGGKILLSSLILALAGLGAYFGGGDVYSFFNGALSGNFFSLERNKLLGSQSFILLNAEEEAVFKPLYLLRRNLEDTQDKLLSDVGQNMSLQKNDKAEAIEDIEDISNSLDNFFKANEDFSWFNMFKSEKSLFSDEELPSHPEEIILLSQIVKKKTQLQEKIGFSIEPSNEEVANYLDWLEFWEELLTQSGDYLVISTHPYRESPVGGEPHFYSLVRIEDEKLSVVLSGDVEDLNAAVTTKIVPPEPIRVLKTNFDIKESGWFLETKEASEHFIEAFTKTTGHNIDGVVWFDHSLLEEIVQKQSFVFNSQQSNWLEDFFDILSRQSNSGWRSLEKSLNLGLSDGRLKLYFKKRSLSNFVEEKNLALKTVSEDKDFLSFGMRSWGGARIIVELLEYRPDFFIDGSVVSNAYLNIKNTESVSDWVYLKFYIPLDSIILNEEGFSNRRTLPEFDYKTQGFQKDLNLSSINFSGRKNNPQLDGFIEGGVLAVGGWVELEPNSRKTVSLHYRLPFRLNWQKGSDEYALRVEKVGRDDDLPFRWQTKIEEGLGLDWEEPVGFLSDSVAEYQANLYKDLNLRLEVNFKNE